MCLLGHFSWHQKALLTGTAYNHYKEFSALLTACSFGRIQASKQLLFSPILTRKAETKCERMDLSKSPKQRFVFAYVSAPCGTVSLL